MEKTEENDEEHLYQSWTGCRFIRHCNTLTKPFVAKRLHLLFIIEVVCKSNKWQ